MSRRLFTFCLALAVVLAGLPALSQAAEFNLSYSNFFPPTHIQSQLAEEWCKEVEARTNGKVHVDYYPGGTLTKAPQAYDGVVEGLSDIAMSACAYSRGRFPTMAAVDLPFGYKSGVAATAVANAVFAKFQPKELSDTHVMYFHAHGPGLLHSAGKPIRTLEDMKGLKFRATGNSAKVVQALGATPVAQSMPDAYQAIQKGVVNGGMYPVETNKGWKMGEVIDFCTESFSVAYTTTFFVVMSKDKWAELPADVQKTITEINKEWSAKHGKAWDESDKAGKEFILSKGRKIITLSPEESARWAKAVEPMFQAYEEDMKDKGLDGEAVVRFTMDTLKSLQ